MKSFLKSGWKYMLGSVLALLGFGGCSEDGGLLDIGGGLAMYGQPFAHFKMLGTVKNRSGQPVRGIRVVIAPRPENDLENDTLYTDVSGHFQKDMLKYDWPDDLKYVTLKFEDVDGAENGSYQMKELKRSNLKVEQTDKKGKDGWYQGAFTYSVDAVLDEE